MWARTLVTSTDTHAEGEAHLYLSVRARLSRAGGGNDRGGDEEREGERQTVL